MVVVRGENGESLEWGWVALKMRVTMDKIDLYNTDQQNYSSLVQVRNEI